MAGCWDPVTGEWIDSCDDVEMEDWLNDLLDDLETAPADETDNHIIGYPSLTETDFSWKTWLVGSFIFTIVMFSKPWK